jgi:hypothetical protein
MSLDKGNDDKASKIIQFGEFKRAREVFTPPSRAEVERTAEFLLQGRYRHADILKCEDGFQILKLVSAEIESILEKKNSINSLEARVQFSVKSALISERIRLLVESVEINGRSSLATMQTEMPQILTIESALFRLNKLIQECQGLKFQNKNIFRDALRKKSFREDVSKLKRLPADEYLPVLQMKLAELVNEYEELLEKFDRGNSGGNRPQLKDLLEPQDTTPKLKIVVDNAAPPKDLKTGQVEPKISIESDKQPKTTGDEITSLGETDGSTDKKKRRNWRAKLSAAFEAWNKA